MVVGFPVAETATQVAEAVASPAEVEVSVAVAPVDKIYNYIFKQEARENGILRII